MDNCTHGDDCGQVSRQQQCCTPCHANASICRRYDADLGRWEFTGEDNCTCGADWCKCLPIRACATLLDDCSGSSPTGALAYAYLSLDCELQPWRTWDVYGEDKFQRRRPGYSGKFVVRLDEDTLVEIDITVVFDDDEYGELWAYLESEVLGYAYDGSGSDTRIAVPMGGEYFDDAVRRATCLSLGLTFDVDMSSVLPVYGMGCITLDAADMAYDVPAFACGDRADTPTCICERACVTYEEFDEYGAVTYTEMNKVCIDDHGQWVAEFHDGDIVATIEVSSEDPLTFLLTPGGTIAGSLDYADSFAEACCPPGMTDTSGSGDECGCLMDAEWDVENTVGSETTTAKISIRGDARYHCADCKCFCRCLCVRVYDLQEGEEYEAVVCWEDDGYSSKGWSGFAVRRVWDSDNDVWTTDPESTFEINLQLKCNQCTGVTSLWLVDYDLLYPLDSCPDIFGSFSIVEYGEIRYSVRVECAVCPQDCQTGGRLAECCEDQVPEVLYATLQSFGECTGDPVVIPLLLREITTLNPDAPYFHPVVDVPRPRRLTFVSDETTYAGIGATPFRLYAAPCQDTEPPCGSGEISWKAYMESENTDCIYSPVSCESGCSGVLLTGSLQCFCIAADPESGVTITITE